MTSRVGFNASPVQTKSSKKLLNASRVRNTFQIQANTSGVQPTTSQVQQNTSVLHPNNLGVQTYTSTQQPLPCPGPPCLPRTSHLQFEQVALLEAPKVILRPPLESSSDSEDGMVSMQVALPERCELMSPGLPLESSSDSEDEFDVEDFEMITDQQGNGHFTFFQRYNTGGH